jgi:hypothetical protein
VGLAQHVLLGESIGAVVRQEHPDDGVTPVDGADDAGDPLVPDELAAAAEPAVLGEVGVDLVLEPADRRAGLLAELGCFSRAECATGGTWHGFSS